MKSYLILALFCTISFGNPILVEVSDHHIIGGRERHSGVAFQKDSEDLQIVLKETGIVIKGMVTYIRTAKGYDGFTPKVYLDFPIVLPRSKYSEKIVEERYKNVLISPDVRVIHAGVRSVENHVLYKSFKEARIYEVRSHLKVPEEVDEFTVEFEYFQEDILESGMAFGLYMPLFEDGFPRDRLDDYFEVRILDPQQLLVDVKGLKKKSLVSQEPIYFPILNEVIRISKKSQQVAGGDATR